PRGRRQGDRHHRRARADRRRRQRQRPCPARLAARAVRREGARAQARQARARGRGEPRDRARSGIAGSAPAMGRVLVFRLLACTALTAAHLAWAQPAARPDDARTCATTTGQPAIDACTRALGSRRFTRSELALLHYRRAMLLRETGALD